MYVKELWRFPVRSSAGERLNHIDVDQLGFEGDRNVLVRGRNRRVIASRTHPKLLGLKGSVAEDGRPIISGHP